MARIIGLACASILPSYWLIELSDKVSIFNIFRYITFRTGVAIVTALVHVANAARQRGSRLSSHRIPASGFRLWQSAH
jgi:hypothetical protein